MKTISELMEGKKPGEIKIVRKEWGSHYFLPYFKTTANVWYGLNPKGLPDSYYDGDVWSIYDEPKPKKIVYEWMVKYADAGWCIFDTLRTEEKAAKHYEGKIYKKKQADSLRLRNDSTPKIQV